MSSQEPERKPPMSERFDALPVVVRIVVIGGIIAAGAVAWQLVDRLWGAVLTP